MICFPLLQVYACMEMDTNKNSLVWGLIPIQSLNETTLPNQFSKFRMLWEYSSQCQRYSKITEHLTLLYLPIKIEVEFMGSSLQSPKAGAPRRVFFGGDGWCGFRSAWNKLCGSWRH